MPYAQFRLVLRQWTQDTRYLLAVATGVERRNLDGSPAGVPAEDQQAFARELLRKREHRASTGRDPSPPAPPCDDAAAGEP